MMRAPPRMSAARGLALVAVLWVVAALSLLVASLLAVSRAGTAAATTHAALVRASALGDAGIQLALVEWPHEVLIQGVHHFRAHYHFDGHDIAVELLPASAYVDLNRAPLELLSELFRSGGGLDDARAHQLGERVIDWRDADDVAQDGGSELDPYVAAGLAVRPRNGSFQSKEDLLQVAGISLDLFARIEPFITVWSGSSGVDPHFAPVPVLAILAGGDQALAQGLAAQRERLGKLTDTTRLNAAYLGQQADGRVLHARAHVDSADGARILRARWIEFRHGEDGTPWQTLAVEAPRFEAEH